MSRMSMARPRFLKSKPAKIHVGKDIIMRGWKLPCKWTVIARKGDGASFQRMTLSRPTLEEARLTGKELFLRGWETVEFKENELLTPLRRKISL
jgi:hypothetical protein